MIKNIALALLLIVAIACQSTPSRNIATKRNVQDTVRQLARWETGANGVANRSQEVIRIEHYEIPLKLLEQNFEETIDPKLKDSLIFEKKGEKYVRWMINPEDTKWHLEVEEFLKKNNVSIERKRFFDGYLTASRSMIIFNPDNGASFSLKVSTNKTGGNWTDKKQTYVDATQVRNMDKWIAQVTSTMKTDALVIMNDPIAFGIKDIDHGMIMRSLNDLPEDEYFYLPGFSALHEKEGARIALLNGSKDPAAFWTKHFAAPLGRAMAEFFAFTGASYDSPHSQNFLIELDRDYRPTGRIVFRDLGDTYLLKDFVINTKYASYLDKWEDGNVHELKTRTLVGLLHGNQPPSWIKSKEYEQMSFEVLKNFEDRFSQLTGVSKKSLNDQPYSHRNGYSYYGKNYATQDNNWENYLKYANCFGGEKKTLKGEPCPEKILKLQVRPVDCKNSFNAIMEH